MFRLLKKPYYNTIDPHYGNFNKNPLTRTPAVAKKDLLRLRSLGVPVLSRFGGGSGFGLGLSLGLGL